MQLLQSEDAKPSWKYRRQIIRISLVSIGLMALGLELTCCISVLCGLFNKTVSVPQTLADTMDNMFYVLGFVFSSIIGSYIFGASYDTSKFRTFLLNSANALVEKPGEK
jgi:hypothetical protein